MRSYKNENYAILRSLRKMVLPIIDMTSDLLMDFFCLLCNVIWTQSLLAWLPNILLGVKNIDEFNFRLLYFSI